MTAEIFMDVIGGINFSAGLVRMDLTSRDSDGHAEVRQRLVMPIQGFIAALASMTALAEKLTANLPPPSPAVSADPQPPQSPNFR